MKTIFDEFVNDETREFIGIKSGNLTYAEDSPDFEGLHSAYFSLVNTPGIDMEEIPYKELGFTRRKLFYYAYASLRCTDSQDLNRIGGDHSPSFVRNITIQSFEGATFYIDYSQNGCNAPLTNPDNPCADRLPFTVNGEQLSPMFNDTIKDGPLTYFWAQNMNTESDGCRLFELTCPADAVHLYYAGTYSENEASDPLFRDKKSEPIYSRASATTVYSDSKFGCTFCLEFETRDVVEQLNAFSLWTPFWYPWIFDKADQLWTASKKHKQEFYGTFDTPENRLTTFRVEYLDGGRLEANGFIYDNDESDPCTDAQYYIELYKDALKKDKKVNPVASLRRNRLTITMTIENGWRDGKR
ncbi:unnamed protein product, partial [Mesorhabditis belari]|uniref:Uncharacterized protein n=1 Tax=Mesorhabditis belari TaxID=2138241 RepID=A0AAF3ERF8_9BILA